MKLSQNHIASQQDKLREVDSFNRRLQRQRIGFGLLTPGFGLPPDGNDASYYSGQNQLSARLSISSFNQSASNRISLIRDVVRKAIAFTAQSWQALRARQQQRNVIRSLLSASDHYLDDIGLNRLELELLLQTNDNLEELIEAHRKDKQHGFLHGAQSSNSEHDRESWSGHGVRLDRAA